MYTIDGFDSLTEQQIFDMAVEHIGKTRKKSYVPDSSGNGCKYTGSGCNAVPLLKPEYRHAADNHGSWVTLINNNLVTDTNSLFISRMQFAHDSAISTPSEFMADWYKNMTALAETYKLDTTKLNALVI